MSRITRGLALLGAGALVVGLAACATPAAEPGAETGAPISDPIKFAAPLPLSGNSAQYGEYFQQGYELALEQINAAGGIAGRQVELVYEDTQADPAVAPSVAQKFIDDPSILATFADFGTPAASAASGLYQEAGLVQFAFTQSGAAITDPGDYIWATWVSQEFEAPRLATFAAEHGKTAAVFSHDTDWGKDTYEFFSGGAEKAGLEQVYSTAYDPNGTDYRPLLLAAQATNPEVIVIIGYAADGALLTLQAREIGIETPIVGISSIYNQQFIELAAEAAEGVETLSYFTPVNPDPAVQQFIADFKAAYGVDTPSDFAIRAYDALQIVATAAQADFDKTGEITRSGIKDALQEGTDFPTVLYGDITFNEKRRLADAVQYPLVVKDGAFELRG